MLLRIHVSFKGHGAPLADRPTFGDDVVGGPVALVTTTIASTLVAAGTLHPVRTAEAEATTPGLGSALYCAHCQQIKSRNTRYQSTHVYQTNNTLFFSTFMQWALFLFLFVLNNLPTISFKDNGFRILCLKRLVILFNFSN